jgi:antitoxin (DNA-binding transcriptional repressor) of toxin-antitoxin stability system
MKVSVTEAEEQLPDLVRRAENGEEVVLTRDGRDVVRFEPVPANAATTSEERRLLFAELRRKAKERGPDGGPSAARSQDFLYDESGLPK